MKWKIRKEELLSVEKEFFRLDRENRIGCVEMSFESPDDIFDLSICSLTPRFNQEFTERVIDLFNLIPGRYQLDISVLFDDMAGYSEARLFEIWKKNMLLQARILLRETKSQNHLALGLCLTGLIFILLSILVDGLWTEESTLREVIVYVLDIIATVPFWGAMDIYFIENGEKKRHVRDLLKKYHTITFRQKAD